MKRVAGGIAAVVAAFIIGSCAGTVHEPPVPALEPAPVQDLVHRETGIASWYGREFQGRVMANGDRFDMEGLSAAHRILPLGTELLVTNLENSKNIKVRVTDRGPFVKGRVLELSYGAAKELGFVSQGTASVNFETLEPVGDGGVYTVQAAVFAEEEHARNLKERLQRKYEVVYIVPYESNVGKFFRVRVGAYPNGEKAERIAAKLTLDGLEPVVVRKD